MTRMNQKLNPASVALGNAALLRHIDHVIDLCRGQMPNAAVAYEIEHLQQIRQSVALDQPLPKQIVLGAFAAKNIDDWNPELAGELMTLDAEVRRSASRTKDLAAVQTA